MLMIASFRLYGHMLNTDGLKRLLNLMEQTLYVLHGHLIIDHDMTAQDIMSIDFLYVAPDDLASECLNQMAKKKIGCLAVMQDDDLVGVVNQKDLIKLGI